MHAPSGAGRYRRFLDKLEALEVTATEWWDRRGWTGVYRAMESGEQGFKDWLRPPKVRQKNNKKKNNPDREPRRSSSLAADLLVVFAFLAFILLAAYMLYNYVSVEFTCDHTGCTPRKATHTAKMQGTSKLPNGQFGRLGKREQQDVVLKDDDDEDNGLRHYRPLGHCEEKQEEEVERMLSTGPEFDDGNARIGAGMPSNSSTDPLSPAGTAPSSCIYFMSLASAMTVICIELLHSLEIRWLALRVVPGQPIPKFARNGVSSPDFHYTIRTWPGYAAVKLLTRLENTIRVHGTLALYLGILFGILACIVYAGTLAVGAARDSALQDALKRVIVHPLSPYEMQSYVWQAMRSKTIVVPRAALQSSADRDPSRSDDAVASSAITSDDYEDADGNGIPDSVERDAVERFAMGSSEALDRDVMRRRHENWLQLKHSQRMTGLPPDSFPCTEDDEIFANKRCNREQTASASADGTPQYDTAAAAWRASTGWKMPVAVNSVTMEDVTAGTGRETLCDFVYLFNPEIGARTLSRSQVCWDLINLLLLHEFAPAHTRSQLAITRSVLVNDEFVSMLRDGGDPAASSNRGVAKALLDAIDQSIRSLGKQTMEAQATKRMDCVCSAHLGIARLFAFVVKKHSGDAQLFIDYNITMPATYPVDMYDSDGMPTSRMDYDQKARPELFAANEIFWRELNWVSQAENPKDLTITYWSLPDPVAAAAYYGREYGSPVGAMITTDAHEKQLDEALLAGTASTSAKALKRKEGYALSALVNRVAQWMKSSTDRQLQQQQQSGGDSSAAMEKKAKQRVQNELTATKATLIRQGLSEARESAYRSRSVSLPGPASASTAPITRSWPQQILLSLGMINESAMLEKYLSKATANMPQEPRLVRKVAKGLTEDVEVCLVSCKEMTTAIKERRAHIGNKLIYGREDAYGSFPRRDLNAIGMEDEEELQQQSLPTRGKL